MKKTILFFAYFAFPILIFSQNTYEKDMDYAIQNAKKGIYWASENVPESKGSLNKDIILENKLIASVKISKEIEGVCIESTGFYNTYEAALKIYVSYDSLKTKGLGG